MVKIGHAQTHKAPVKKLHTQSVSISHLPARIPYLYVCLMMKIKVIRKCSLEYCTRLRIEILEMNWNEMKEENKNETKQKGLVNKLKPMDLNVEHKKMLSQ